MTQLNPFRRPTITESFELESARQQQEQAERRYLEHIEAYREMLRDPRYASIAEDAQQLYQAHVVKLVDTASACAHCAPMAERLKLLSEIVLYPQRLIEAVRLQQAAQPPAPEMTIEDVHAAGPVA